MEGKAILKGAVGGGITFGLLSLLSLIGSSENYRKQYPKVLVSAVLLGATIGTAYGFVESTVMPKLFTEKKAE